MSLGPKAPLAALDALLGHMNRAPRGRCQPPPPPLPRRLGQQTRQGPIDGRIDGKTRERGGACPCPCRVVTLSRALVPLVALLRHTIIHKSYIIILTQLAIHTRSITLQALLQLLVAQLLQAAVSDAVEMRLACWTRRIQTSLCHPQVAAVAKEVAFRALEDVT